MLGAFGTWGVWPALTAIGTVGAVIVAVGLQGWLEWKRRTRRPELTLEFDSNMRNDERDARSNATVPFLRLAVANAAEKDTAQDVELLILDIDEFATTPAGSGGRKIWLANPALAWANSVDPLPRMSIPPGATRYADVGRWVQTEMDLSMILCVVPEPGSDRHILSEGGWRLRLAATMRNGEASFWEAAVSYGASFTAGIAQLTDLEAKVKRLDSAAESK